MYNGTRMEGDREPSKDEMIKILANLIAQYCVASTVDMMRKSKF